MQKQRILVKLVTLSTLFFSAKLGFAEPWYTGPLLAPAGRTIPNGHTNFELYGFYTLDTGFYNNAGRHVRAPTDNSEVINPVFSHGITEKMDLQFSIPFVNNRAQGTRSRRIGDFAATLGFQLWEQKKSKWIPNARFTLQEIVPTGKFQQLNPALNGTDATGLGVYQTLFGINFQHLAQITEANYLRTRLVINYAAANSTHVHGLSSYGGTPMTVGDIKPGDLWSADLAGEYNLTQKWVAVLETFISRRQATNFHGYIGNNPDGTPGTIGRGISDLYTLAPAIEYNFNANIGIIGGTWFTLGGRNTSRFNSYILGLNAYW